MSTLYERLGGAPAVDQAVQIFYRKVLSDDRIQRFFDGVDMDGQIAKQKAFLTMALGGPSNYTGKDLRTAHAPLVEKGLNDSHFDAVVENLVATLKELGVGDELIGEVGALLGPTRSDVLGR
jgi:hemoglobin